MRSIIFFTETRNQIIIHLSEFRALTITLPDSKNNIYLVHNTDKSSCVETKRPAIDRMDAIAMDHRTNGTRTNDQGGKNASSMPP